MKASVHPTMISRFHVKNFRSIVDLDLSFRFGEKQAPNGYKSMNTWPFLENKTGRFVPCLAIYGPNAGGKTNIVRAFQAFKGLVWGKSAAVQYDPNRLHPELKETVMELEWSQGSVLYELSLRYTGDGIVHESLSLNGNELYSIDNAKGRFDQLAVPEYSPEYTPERLQTILNVECTTADDHQQQSLFLKTLASKYMGLNAAVTKAWYALTFFIHTYPDNEAPTWLAIDVLEGSVDKHQQERMRERVFELIQRLDLGIKGIDYKREVSPSDEAREWERGQEPCSILEKGTDLRCDSIYTWHEDTQGKLVRFNVNEESRGTRLLIGLCCLIVAALETGRTMIIDEIDQSLHPLLLETIVRLFKSKEHNRHNAQLIFTTHTTDLLANQLLRTSEVAIVEKNLAQGTQLVRLSDIRGIRNVTDYRRRYLEGELGGIPFPYL